MADRCWWRYSHNEIIFVTVLRLSQRQTDPDSDMGNLRNPNSRDTEAVTNIHRRERRSSRRAATQERRKGFFMPSNVPNRGTTPHDAQERPKSRRKTFCRDLYHPRP